jgi:tripartite-type tricarboxylate transporter receptor subunit TctC
MPKEAVEWHIDLLKKVSDSKEFKNYLLNNALKAAWQTGPDYVKWVDGAEKLHKDLMDKAGLLKK